MSSGRSASIDSNGLRATRAYVLTKMGDEFGVDCAELDHADTDALLDQLLAPSDKPG